MTLRTVGSRLIGESVDDVVSWVTRLTGCPPVTHTKVATCAHPLHDDETASWFYVEADPEAGVARLRCIAGGHVHEVLDSAEHWTYPRAWQCPACGQSIAEVVYGVHAEDGIATWLLAAVRCVDCGEITGVTDLIVANLPVDDLLAQL
ncbi:MAG TPA: hypothetical protein VHB69_12790 [Mycobacteriales bacterium]|nr:hypothetical protein [Mycobacteriales bacterium]